MRISDYVKARNLVGGSMIANELAGIGGVSFYSNVSEAGVNLSGIQSLLNNAGNIGVSYVGSLPINGTLMIGSDTSLFIQNNTELKLTGGNSWSIVKTGNAAFSGTPVMKGVYPITSDSGATRGVGTLTYTNSTTSLTYTAPGDTAGAPVSVSAAQGTAAKYRVASSNGQAIYVSIAKAAMYAADKTQQITVSGVTGAKSVSWAVVSNICTVTESGHGRKIGDMVEMLPGSGAVRGVYEVLTTPSSDTYTFAKTTGDSSGTGYAFGVRNIKLYGDGIVNMDYATNTTALDDVSGTMAIVLNMASECAGLTWRIKNAKKYAWYLTGVANSEAHPGELDTHSDGFHINGPARNLTVNNVNGVTGDNMFALGHTDYPQYLINWPDTDGTSTDGIEVHGLTPINALEAFRIYGSSGNTFKNTKIYNCRGYASEAAAQYASIIDDGNIYLGTGGNIDGLRIDGVKSDFGPNSLDRSIYFSMSGTLAGIAITDFTFPNLNTGVGAVRIAGGVTIEDIVFQNIRTPSNFTGVFLELFSNASGRGRIKHCTFSNVTMRHASGSGNPVLVSTSYSNGTYYGQIDHLIINGITVLNAVGANTRVISNSGKIVSCTVVNGKFDGINAVFRNESTAQTGLKSSFDSLHFEGSNNSFVITADVACSANFSNLTGTVVRMFNNVASSGTHKVRACNIGNLTATTHIQNPSTATWDVHGAEIHVDVTAVARIDGNIIYNTNAAAGTLGVSGLVMCQGTAANSWKLMSNTSLAY